MGRPYAEKELVGRRSGRLVIVKTAGKASNRARLVECICDCGNKTICRWDGFQQGKTKSCGCLNREQQRKNGLKTIHIAIQSKVTHNLTNHPLYNTFKRMKRRCLNPKDKNYASYGGRGIAICKEWLNDVSLFVEWSTKNGWKRGLSIDRIDNDGNYTPENCRWVDQKTQCNNTRRTKFLVFKGRRQSITQWAEEFNLDPSNVGRRLKNGWTIEEALNLV